MDNPTLDSIEQRLTQISRPGAPAELRGAVLADVQRQLRAQRWDRSLLRMAAAVLVAGIGLNAWVTWQGAAPGDAAVIANLKQDVIVQAGVAVAQVTNASTGHQFARHLAALSGKSLTEEQSKAIQQHAKPRGQSGPPSPKDG